MAGNVLSQTIAITAMNLRNIKERMASSVVAVVGITGVVVVLIGVLSIAAGFRAVLDQSGQADVAIVLRNGATDEMGSSLLNDQTRIISDAKDAKRDADGVIASPELYVVVDVPLVRTGTVANVPLRGVGPQAPKLRRNFKIVEGRAVTPGTFEIMVGSGASQQFAGLTVGNKVRWGTTDWTVVGIFEDKGSVSESEIWTDATVLQGVYSRGSSYQSMRVRLTSAGAFGSFKDTLTSDPRVNVRVFTEKEYYEQQSLNTMYSAVSSRTREIATLRALGFGRTPISISVQAEAVLIGVVGGLAGMLIAYFAFNGMRASTMNFSTFSQITFAFTVTPEILLTGFSYALGLSFIASRLPARRATRMPITAGLREL
jgi:putative ABC transport system permease protein